MEGLGLVEDSARKGNKKRTRKKNDNIEILSLKRIEKKGIEITSNEVSYAEEDSFEREQNEVQKLVEPD